MATPIQLIKVRSFNIGGRTYVIGEIANTGKKGLFEYTGSGIEYVGEIQPTKTGLNVVFYKNGLAFTYKIPHDKISVQSSVLKTEFTEEVFNSIPSEYRGVCDSTKASAYIGKRTLLVEEDEGPTLLVEGFQFTII